MHWPFYICPCIYLGNACHDPSPYVSFRLPLLPFELPICVPKDESSLRFFMVKRWSTMVRWSSLDSSPLPLALFSLSLLPQMPPSPSANQWAWEFKPNTSNEFQVKPFGWDWPLDWQTLLPPLAWHSPDHHKSKCCRTLNLPSPEFKGKK